MLMILNRNNDAFARIEAMSPRTPGGNYVPFKQVGELVYLSGQTNSRDGKLTQTGQVGVDVSVEDGYAGARVCMENLFGTLKQAVGGDWNRVLECKGPAVINGASDLVVELMGEAGRHARSAVGVAALPGNATVEVEAIFRIKV
jgi:enamine deaminase RidA (YjgF/YER057c/UK114 family)